MPEYLKALIVILVLATVVFAFAKAPACASASTAEDFVRRRNLWFGVTLTAFLAHDFWIYIIVSAVLLLYAESREPNKLAMFFFLLFAAPPISAQISGLGIIQHFFAIDYLRLLTLSVLLPAWLSLRKRPDTERFGRTLPDKFIVGYIILCFMLMLQVSTFTNTLRIGVFYSFIDIFLPYYIASRSLNTIEEFRDALMSFVVAAMVLGAIAVFEFAKHWLLYAPLDEVLGAQWSLGHYLERAENLRAQGSTGQAIVLGYVMAVATGIFLYLKKSVLNPVIWSLGLIGLIAGLIASLSRGPWVGAAVMLLVFIATGPSRGTNLARLGLFGALILPALVLTPVGDKIVSYLPFVGTIEENTVNYRQRLLEISIEVIKQNPFFGAYDFFYSPAMQELKQGNGFLDIVNSYLAVALSGGLVGLLLYVGFFITVTVGIFKAMRSVADKNSELHFLGQGLFATLIGIMVTIFTVSSISFIPVIYWSIAGLGVAYARVLVRTNAGGAVPAISRQQHISGNAKLNSRGSTAQAEAS